MKVGFIGAGSMGSLLVEAFIRAGAMRPGDIAVSSRTHARAEALANRFSGLCVTSNAEVAKQAHLLFLCVKPVDYRDVLHEIAPGVRPEQIVVSITSPVKLAQLEKLLPCKAVKIIPSIANAAHAGALLLMWGTRLENGDRELLTALFSKIGRIAEISEDDVRAASDISSCGPAFFAYLIDAFADAAVTQSGLERQTAIALASEMLLGTARLLIEHGFSTAELQSRVSVPGGITAAALETLQAHLGDAFKAVLRVTHAKFAEDLEKVERMLFPPSP
jgi:competence protein ComER